MTTTVFLVRHARHELQDQALVGRTEGVRLAEASAEDLERLRAFFSDAQLDAVRASPLERAQDTAGAVAGPDGPDVETDPDLNEMDFGEWTGRPFAELQDDPAYLAWNASKLTAPTPGGETTPEVQARMTRALMRARADWPEGRVALVGHGDPLQTLVCAALGLPADSMRRFDLDPASVTTLVVGDWGVKVVRLNERVTG